MAYFGNTPTTQNFTSGTDYFSGTGSQTAFTLTRVVNSPNDIEVVINNVVQQPNSAYTLNGTTITFTSAPSTGTQNIYVRYLSTATQVVTPSQNSVGSAQLTSLSYINFTDGSSQNTAARYGMRNRIINGDMRIDQRNAGASVTPANTYTLDRWQGVVSQTGKFTVQQNVGSVTPPSGYKNYLGVTSSSSYSVLTGDYFMISQRIEGYNFADLMFGTASAQTFTFSFWVRSSLTGTFGGSFQGAASATLRSYPFSYTISSANTWEQKSITVAGDTFTNTWDSTNGIGLFVNFGLGAGASASGTAGSWASANYANATGAISVVGTSGATFYITGVQLEVGSSATGYEYRQYQQELALCQRYYEKYASTDNLPVGFCYAANNLNTPIIFIVEKRATPTLIRSGTYTAFVNGGGNTLTYSGYGGGTKGVNIGWTGSGISAGQAFSWSNPANPQVAFDAEL